ncbi:MAG: hopanoid biosynthesis-associated protein HpnK [Terriglobales bacterium]
MRRLIVNADDFGLTPGINRAIVEAHGSGIVTSTTLMANGPAFTAALEQSQSVPTLDIGCHVVLLDGQPVLSSATVPALVDPKRSSDFRQKLRSFAAMALSGRLPADQVEAEATAQIRKLQSHGISVSHLDTHKHAHVFPQILKPLLRAAVACGVRAIRNPFEIIRLSAGMKNLRQWKRHAQLKILHNLASSFHREVQAAGMLTPTGTIGIAATGVLDEQLFRSLIEGVPEGTWEFVCHPGYNDVDLKRVRTRLRESRVQELAILKSANVRELLKSHGIELVSYRSLL